MATTGGVVKSTVDPFGLRLEDIEVEIIPSWWMSVVRALSISTSRGDPSDPTTTPLAWPLTAEEDARTRGVELDSPEKR